MDEDSDVHDGEAKRCHKSVVAALQFARKELLADTEDWMPSMLISVKRTDTDSVLPILAVFSFFDP
jgi:hypothetical protein